LHVCLLETMFPPLSRNGRPLVPSEEDSMICEILLLYIAKKVPSQYHEIVPWISQF